MIIENFVIIVRSYTEPIIYFRVFRKDTIIIKSSMSLNELEKANLLLKETHNYINGIIKNAYNS